MLLAYLACSLDGFIAGEAGELDWLDRLAAPKITYYDFAALMNDIDCVLMGANSFRKVLTFDQWPYSKKVFVYTSTMPALAPEMDGRAEIISGNPIEVKEKLAGRGYGNIYIDGGMTIRSFLAAGLLDEIYICHVSIVLGGGISLFGGVGMEIPLEVVEAKRLTGQMTLCRYRVIKASALRA